MKDSVVYSKENWLWYQLGSNAEPPFMSYLTLGNQG